MARDLSGPPVKVRRWDVIGGIALVNGFRYGAELGVSTGRFTGFLCAIMPKLHMIAVDRWAPSEPRPGVHDHETYSTWDHEGTYANFKATVAKHFPTRVNIMRMDTQEAHKLVHDGSLDFVFIDADHTYEGCAADIANWTPKVRPGGLISGHDINWPGVLKAVKESGDFQTGSDNVWLRGQRMFQP